MLLPVTLLVRRADTAVVIDAALAARAAGVGHRRVAASLGRPAETVRGWLRRFAAWLGPVRAVFTRWCRALEPDPDRVLPGPAGSAWADTVGVIGAAASVVSARFRPGSGPGSRPGGVGAGGCVVGEVARWEVAVAVSAGRLLAPDWPDRAAWSGSKRVHPAAD